MGERVGNDAEHLFVNESNFVLQQSEDAVSISKVIKNANELVNSPDNMNSETDCDGSLTIEKSTDSCGELCSVRESNVAFNPEKKNGNLLINELEEDRTLSVKSTSDNSSNVTVSEQKSLDNSSATVSILDLDNKDASSASVDSAAPSRAASSIDNKEGNTPSVDNSFSVYDENSAASVRLAEVNTTTAAVSSVSVHEKGHSTAVESELLHGQVDKAAINSEPVGFASESALEKNRDDQEADGIHKCTETEAEAETGVTPVSGSEGIVKNSTQAANQSDEHVSASVIVVGTGSEIISAPGSTTVDNEKANKSKEKPREFKYKSDLTPAIVKYYEYHKDKRHEDYEEVHEALRAWSSDEECKTDRTPRTEDEPVHCVLCSFKTLKHAELNQHILVIHVAGKKSHSAQRNKAQCPDCHKAFQSESGLQTHRQRFHPSLLTCPDCPYSSYCKFHLIFHQVIYHPQSRAGKQFYNQTWNRGPYKELYSRFRESPSLISKGSQPLPEDPFNDECYDLVEEVVPCHVKIKDIVAKDVVTATDGVVSKIISDVIQQLQRKRESDDFVEKQSSLQMIELERKASFHSDKVLKMLDCPRKDPSPKLTEKPRKRQPNKPDIMLLFQDMIKKRYCLLCEHGENNFRQLKIHRNRIIDHLFRHFSLKTHYCFQCGIMDCNFATAPVLLQHITYTLELKRRQQAMIEAANQKRFLSLMSDTKARLMTRSRKATLPHISPAPSVSNRNETRICIKNTHQKSVLQRQAEVVNVGKGGNPQGNDQEALNQLEPVFQEQDEVANVGKSGNQQRKDHVTLLQLLPCVPVTLVQLQPVTVLQHPDNIVNRRVTGDLIQVDPDERDDGLSFEEQRYNFSLNQTMLPSANNTTGETSVSSKSKPSKLNQDRLERNQNNCTVQVQDTDELNTRKENANPPYLTMPKASSENSMIVEESSSSEFAREDAIKNCSAVPVLDQTQKCFGSVSVTNNEEQQLQPTVIFDDYFSFEELRFALYVYAMHTHPRKRSTLGAKSGKNKKRSKPRISKPTTGISKDSGKESTDDSDRSDDANDPYYRIDNEDLPYEPSIKLPVERRSYPKRKRKKNKPFTLLNHEPPETDDEQTICIDRESDKADEEREPMQTHDNDHESDQFPEEDDNFINGIYLEAGYGIDLSFPADDEIFDFAEDSAESANKGQQNDVKREYMDTELSFCYTDVGELKEEDDYKDCKDCHMSALNKENEDTNSSLTSDQNVQDELTVTTQTAKKSTARKSTARKSTVSAEGKNVVLNKRKKGKRKLQNISDEVESTEEISPTNPIPSSEQFLPENNSSLNLPDNIPKLLQEQIRKQVIEKSVVSNRCSSARTAHLENEEPRIVPCDTEKVEYTKNKNKPQPKKRKRSRKPRYTTPRKKISRVKSPDNMALSAVPGLPVEHESVKSPGPPVVMPLKSPGPPTVRLSKSPGPPSIKPPKSPGPPSIKPPKSPGPPYVRPLKSPGPPSVRPLKSPGPPIVRPVEPPQPSAGNSRGVSQLRVGSLSTTRHLNPACQKTQRVNAKVPRARVVVFEKVTDIEPPGSPSMPRVTPLQPVLSIPMSDPSAAAQQIMYQQRQYVLSHPNVQPQWGNGVPEQRSSQPQINPQSLPQSSNVTTNSNTTNRATSVQMIPCPVNLSNFKSCEYCNKRFKSLFCAKIHYWVDHQQLSYNPDLLLPLPRYSQQEVENRVCPYCRFKLLGDNQVLFETHILTHLQLLPYLCIKCSFPAVSPNALEKHSCFAERILPLKRERVEPVIPIPEQKFEVKIEQKPTVTLCHELAWKGERG